MLVIELMKVRLRQLIPHHHPYCDKTWGRLLPLRHYYILLFPLEQGRNFSLTRKEEMQLCIFIFSFIRFTQCFSLA